MGTFLVQIARHAGAQVVAICGASKAEAVCTMGAEATVYRKVADLAAATREANGGAPFPLVADVVDGEAFPKLPSLLGRGGRYVTAGAIAGPMVVLDLRTLYLRNLSFFGSTVYLPEAFPALIKDLEAGGLTPAVAREWPLETIRAAQEAFMAKGHVGSMVQIPPGAASRGSPSTASCSTNGV